MGNKRLLAFLFLTGFIVVAVGGTAFAGLQVRPASVNLKYAKNEATKKVFFNIKNTGNKTVVVSSSVRAASKWGGTWKFSKGAKAAAVASKVDILDPVFTLKPGESKDVRVKFTKASKGLAFWKKVEPALFFVAQGAKFPVVRNAQASVGGMAGVGVVCRQR